MALLLGAVSIALAAPVGTSDCPVLAGYDVVEYRRLESGTDVDVQGFAKYSSDVKTSTGTYTFWFATDANRKVFAADPWKYAPAWGGF